MLSSRYLVAASLDGRIKDKKSRVSNARVCACPLNVMQEKSRPLGCLRAAIPPLSPSLWRLIRLSIGRGALSANRVNIECTLRSTVLSLSRFGQFSAPRRLIIGGLPAGKKGQPVAMVVKSITDWQVMRV